jgi:hypothetical protein
VVVGVTGGDPVAGNLANIAGSVTCGQLPALTGNVTTAAGSCATLIAANAVTNAMLAQAPTYTKKCNSTAATANVADCEIGDLHTKDFGATGNGSTDDTTNLQNWLNALKATSRCGFIDPGNYKISAALTFSTTTANNLCIHGAGFYSSTLVPSNTSQDAIDITTTLANGGGPQLDNFGIQPSGTQVSGTCISITGPASSGGILTAHISNLLISQCWNGILFTNSTASTSQTNYISGCLNACIVINNTGFVANGDFGLHNTTVIPAQTSVAGILVSAGSGLRIYGGKILGAGPGTPPGILFSPSTAGAYSDIMVVGTSIESNGSCIKFSKGSATTLVNVNIVGIECSNSGASAILLDLSDANAQWLSGVTITGNIFDMLSNNMTGISIGQSTKDWSVAGNVFRSTTGATGLTGIATSATAGNGSVACDNIFNVASFFSLLSPNAIACASFNGHFNYFGVAPANPVLATCGATGSATTAAGSTDNVGTLTTGTTAATSCVLVFAHTYSTAPRCFCQNAGGGSACAAATTTTSALTLSWASSASQTFNWQCFGN